jgi:hypothetical protein
MSFEQGNDNQTKSLLNITAEKLGLDPKTSSLNDVEAAMLGLPPGSSVMEVEEAKEKLSQEERDRIEMLDV